LDDPAGADPALVVRSLTDVGRANALFGGTRAVLAELESLFAARRGETLTLLDVGTGLGDIPARAVTRAERCGVRLMTIGLERAESAARAAQRALGAAVVADAFHLPFADRSIDIVTCSQVLHHFPAGEDSALLREMDRVAVRRVIVSDLQRSWLAAAGLWLVSFPLGFHPWSRHDGVLSVLRGFTPNELRGLASAIGGRSLAVHSRAGWRVTASWTPAGAH
jgi:2-polyprenyl-3-methyl-5-hydroxy-6-metoxy-1,4-benzoquinol methylase